MNFRKCLLALTVAATLAPLSAQATNGYFSIGYGAKARGLAGAVTAFPQDAMAAAANPAGIAHVGHRADVNVNVFSPVREASVGSGHTESEMNGFIVPSGGYVRPVNDQLTVGITAYANGGMNTFYENDAAGTDTVNLYGAPHNLGVDLAQLIFAPTIAYKINDTHTVGASLLVGYQQFKAYGLQSFYGFKSSGVMNDDGLTNQGYDDAWGVGVRVGWQGNISDKLSLGAAYSSKIYMDEFDKYDQLFAEDGDFDIPANYSVGLAYKATPKSTVTFDIQHIQYSDVKSIANAGPSTGTCGMGTPFCAGQGALGLDNGLGFGWNDMTIFKLGWLYEHNDKFTYRFGVSHGDQPIDDDETLFNVLAPAVIETHATAGFSYRPNGKDDQEFTFTYMHAVHNKVKGDPYAFFGNAVPEIEMYQHAFEFAYAWTF
jgi:long-chain fatty acid transport protein